MTGYLCDFCQQPIDPKSTGVYRRAIGWVKNNKGTPTGLTFPEAAVGWACGVCIDLERLRRRGKSPDGQSSLF